MRGEWGGKIHRGGFGKPPPRTDGLGNPSYIQIAQLAFARALSSRRSRSDAIPPGSSPTPFVLIQFHPRTPQRSRENTSHVVCKATFEVVFHRPSRRLPMPAGA